MKCADCLEQIHEHLGGTLPEAVSAHLLGCPACRAEHARALTVHQLLSLKRHEQPDAAFEVRMAAKIRAALADAPAPNLGIRGFWEELFQKNAFATLRYATAVVALAAVALVWLSVRGTDLPPPGSPADQLAIQAPEAPRALPQPAPTNGTPRYGTGSRLAGFEY